MLLIIRRYQRLSWILLWLTLPLFAQAQNPSGGGAGRQQITGRFYGKIIDDATGKGLGYATVQITGMRFDSVSRSMQPALFGGQLSENNGDFKIENIPVRGEYTLKVSFMGYTNVEQKVSFGTPGGGRPGGSLEKDLGNIKLSGSSEVLEEVVITGEAGQLSLAIDKKIYRPDKDGVASGGTAEDALRNIPSLNVDLDGNVTLRNSAPQIFVDGRPTNLTMDQIPADAIEQVEIITNPSAKYDASGAGGGGILNIVLKKERRIGYNGSVRAGVDMRGRFNFGGDINAREGKFNAFLGGNINQRRNISTGATDRQNFFTNPQTTIGQDNESINDGMFLSGRGGIDWFINNRNTLTLSGNIYGGRFDGDEDIDILTDTLLNSEIIGSSSSLRNNDTERGFQNAGAQLLYKRLFPVEGREFTADVNFNRSKNDRNNYFTTDYLQPEFQSKQQQQGVGSTDLYTFQSDYVSPWGKDKKIEAGIRGSVRDFSSENGNFQYDYGDDQYVRVPGFADNFTYLDQVYAGYGTLTQSFAKWGYQAGLRVESSFYEGTLVDLDTTFQNDYPFVFFPSLFLSYKLNEEDQLQLNYSRRVNRPNFFQLIPFPDFSDSLLLQVGNPNLKPEFTSSVEFSYQNIFAKGHNLLTSLYFRQTDDLITSYQFTAFDENLDRETVVQSYINAISSRAFGLEITSRNTFWKLVELTSNLNFFNSYVDASNVEANLTNEQFSWFIKENLNVKLPKNYTVQFSGSYQSRTALSQGGGGRGGWGGGPSSSAQGYTIPVWFVDFSIRKDLWERKANITLSVQDIFRSRKTGNYSETADFIQESWRRRDPQLVRLNFSYRFGKFDSSLFKRKNTRSEEGGLDF